MFYRAIALAVLFLGSGCNTAAPDSPQETQKSDSEKRLSGSVTPEVKPVIDPAPAVAAGPTVKVSLLNAGAVPLSTLRLQPRKGDKVTAEMSMDMGMEMTINGTPLPASKTPTMRMFMDIDVEEITAENHIRYNFVFTEVKLDESPGTPPAMRAALALSLKSITGISGFGIVDNRGFTQQAEVKIPDGADAGIRQTLEGMKQSLNQLSAPFPEEAVGAGAIWKVEQDVSSNGISLQQTATYTLLSREGNNIRLQVSISQTAAAQNVAAPGLPPGSKVTLTALNSSGDGELQLSLEKIMPTVSSMAMKSKSEMSTEEGGKVQPMSMVMDMKVGLQTR